MLRRPSNRRKKRPVERANLVPILDGVFILIFFLLMSTSFLKIYELESKIPITSAGDPPPPSKKQPLALTMKINRGSLDLYRGIPSQLIRSFKKISEDKYDLETLHNYLVKLKQRHKNEKTIILEPLFDIEYEQIVAIMDAVRMFRNTDPKITVKSKDNVDIIVEDLFSNIVFGNIQS